MKLKILFNNFFTYFDKGKKRPNEDMKKSSGSASKKRKVISETKERENMKKGSGSASVKVGTKKRVISETKGREDEDMESGGSASTEDIINVIDVRKQLKEQGFCKINIYNLFNICKIPNSNTNKYLLKLKKFVEDGFSNDEINKEKLFITKNVFDPFRLQFKLLNDNIMGEKTTSEIEENEQINKFLKTIINCIKNLVYGEDINASYYDVYALKSLKGGVKQQIHTDYLEEELKEILKSKDSKQISNTLIKKGTTNLPFAILLGLQDNTTLEKLENNMTTVNTITYNKGDIVIFNAKFKHGGKGFKKDNVRIHFYVTPYILYKNDETGTKTKVQNTELYLQKEKRYTLFTNLTDFEKLIVQMERYNDILEEIKTSSVSNDKNKDYKSIILSIQIELSKIKRSKDSFTDEQNNKILNLKQNLTKKINDMSKKYK